MLLGVKVVGSMYIQCDKTRRIASVLRLRETSSYVVRHAQRKEEARKNFVHLVMRQTQWKTTTLRRFFLIGTLFCHSGTGTAMPVARWKQPDPHFALVTFGLLLLWSK